MKDQNIIKKIKKGLKVAAISTLLALSLTSCGAVNEDMATKENIIMNAEVLDCDTSYIRMNNDDFLRMKHNNGEPIYVCFDNEYTDELKEEAIKSLDYLFGIVNKINDNYYYEIVDKLEFNLKLNKTKIYYTFGEHISTYGEYSSVAHGHLESHTPWTNRFTDEPVMDYFEVNLNKDYVDNLISEKKDYVNSIEYTFNHELLHAFGLADVYTTLINHTTDKYYGNTYMQTLTDFKKITPNDLACLISLYADKNCDMEKMKTELQKYELKFYKEYAIQCKEKLETKENFSKENFSFSTGILIENEDKTLHGYDYKIKVENEKYKLKIYDHYTNKLLDSCEGETINVEGVLILRDVELKLGMRPYDSHDSFSGGYISDFTFMCKDGKNVFYVYNNNDVMRGNFYEFEKDLTK